ncbi:MAG: efflux RND transporter permease subunit [Bacteroidota bacterium]|nr:efflux RND transporter permease subunit [Bacteroidota bacterium]
MTVSDFALKRPVASIVMSLVILLFGVVGYNFLGVRLYPAIDPPIINVQTSYTGANSDIIESQITEPLEKAINGIEGVKSISSSSSTSSSNITVEFNLDADLEKAANDVRDKASQATRNLPQDLDAPPVVTKADANSDPIITVVVQSTKMNALEMSDYAENVLQEKLQTIPGVSSVGIYGQQRPAMRLWLKPDKLTAYNLTAQDVSNVLSKENVELPGGKLIGNATELIIKTKGRLLSEDDFNNLIIKQINGKIIRFKDIGEAVLGPEDEESGTKINGNNGLMLALIPLPGANDIQIADEFYKRFDQITHGNLPEGLTLKVGYDKSKFVRQSVKDVIETLMIALFLVVLIVFLFFRTTIIALRPLIDIPVSLIGSFFIMYIFGFTINVLTMLAIVLATGLVVDDGIVVTENIFKKREQGMDRWTAAFQGTREIFFAVISTSLTLAIVFIPVIFLQGFTGRLFREFGIVVAGAVLISAFVSLTLTPVLNVFLGGKAKHGTFYNKTEPFFVGLETGYRKILRFFLDRKWITFCILAFCLGIIFILSKVLKSELAPLEDHSIVRTSVTLPEGTDYDYTSNVLNRIAQLQMDSIPSARLIFTRVGAMSSGGGMNGGSVQTYLTDPTERNITQQQIYDNLTRYYKKFSQGRIIPNQEQTISTSRMSSLPVQIVLQNLDFDKIRTQLPRFLDEARKDSTFSNVDVNLKFNKPEINLSIDRLKATDLGINFVDVASTLDYALSGRRYAYYLKNDKQYYVIGQVERKERNKPADISSLYVRSNSGNLIQLDNIVKLQENSSPSTLYHYNRYKAATVSAALAPGKTLGEGIDAMNRIAKKLLDNSFQTALIGTSRDFAESSSGTSFALIFALILIYLILAAQFESFRDPFIIMCTVPLAIAGAMISLWITGKTINIFSEIGMIMLVGIVTKNGILIVEFANQKRKAGLSKAEAVFEAAAARLRPILMTSLATIFGAFPIAFALGAGAQSRVPLGVVVVGGLLFALILTLVVIPVMYLMMASKKLVVIKENTTPVNKKQLPELEGAVTEKN